MFYQVQVSMRSKPRVSWLNPGWTQQCLKTALLMYLNSKTHTEKEAKEERTDQNAWQTHNLASMHREREGS